MSDILYERAMAHGPVVKIRRMSAVGEVPVRAVIEVDRRAGTPRGGIGLAPPLMECESNNETEALATLQRHAEDDRTIVQLMRLKGLR
jgi:hypothetical protein